MPIPISPLRKLIVLIDAENANPKRIQIILDEVATRGVAIIKRIYGDWTNPSLVSWKNCLNQLAIQPVQQFCYTTGKNSTDSMLIIDAMDLLHTGVADGFCIVSSDSDFTRLASRIRESGRLVFGFGEAKTPDSFVSACDEFIFVEHLQEKTKTVTPACHSKPTLVVPPLLTKKPADTKPQSFGSKQVELIWSAYQSLAPDQGWVPLGRLGGQIRIKWSSFSPKTYGFGSFLKFIKSLDLFEVEERLARKGSTETHHFVRGKPIRNSRSPNLKS